jgi:acetyl esterase/lipase
VAEEIVSMSTRHLVDPDLLPGLEKLPSFTFTAEMLPLVRQQMAEFGSAAPGPPIAGVSSEERSVAGADGHAVTVLIHRPDNLPTDAPAVLHIHGGGYVLGSAAMSAEGTRRLALEAECLVVSVDYRLAPDTPHPGPVEDCYAALKWLHDEAETLGIDGSRIVVAGESAGGGLAAALALLARDRGEVAVRHQHLTYPMIDDRTCRDTCNPNAGEFVWTPESNVFGWSSLLGQPAGSEGVSPYAAAARAEDLSGLPSTFIAVGALDLFAEENLEYARRLMRAGVPTELHLYPGAYHGFELAGDASVCRAASRISLEALRKALGTAR